MTAAVYTPAQLKDALGRLGVTAGSTIVVHSSLMHLGKIDRIPISDIPGTVARALREHLGSDGTLVVPAANWDYGKARIPFDVKTSPVTRDMGSFSAHVAALEEASRSPNPIFSVAAVGKDARGICDQGAGNDFGTDSAWDRLFRMNAEIVLLGSRVAELTFVRYIEHRFGVPYLYTKLFETPVLREGRALAIGVTATVRYMKYPAEYDLTRFDKRLREQGVLRETPLGGGKVSALRMLPCFQAGTQALKEDIHFFLKRPPAYVKGEVPLD